MGKIFCVMGKSASGKDTIYRRLMEAPGLGLERIVLYTTRPIREGEDSARYEALLAAGKVIEARSYDTMYGVWTYFTAEEGIDLAKTSYLTIGTLESYEKLKSYFGEKQVVPVYVELEDGERLSRALARERLQETPRYAELCRRFLADCADFSEEKLAAAGINRRFVNDDLERCCGEILRYIEENK